MEQAELMKKLSQYEDNLKSVETALAAQPDNNQLLELKKDLREYIELTRDLLGVSEKPSSIGPAPGKAAGVKTVEVGQYVSVACAATQGKYQIAVVTDAPAGAATCTVAPLGTTATETVQVSSLKPAKILKPTDLPVGTLCEAIFSEDGRWYNAQITSVVSATEYHVTYTDYGNSEVVVVQHIRLPDSSEAGGAGKAVVKGEAGKDGLGGGKKRKEAESSATGEFVVPEKYRILPTDSPEVREQKKKKAHQLKSAHRLKKVETEKTQSAQSWNSFNQKAAKGSAKLKGFMSKNKKESIFKTTDDGKVGVIGSGKGITEWKHHDVHALKKVQGLADNEDDDE